MLVGPRSFDLRNVTSPGNRSNPQPGDPCHTLHDGAADTVLAFKASHFTRGKDGAPADVVPPLSADADKGDQDTLVLAFSSKDHGADAGEIAPTLRSMGHDGSHANGGGQVAIAFNIYPKGGQGADLTTDRGTRIVTPHGPSDPVGFQSSQSGVRLVEAHATLDAHMGSRRHNGVVADMHVRRITPTEAERLMGFPDGWTDVPYRGKPASDGPRYKALGNSMGVPEIRWIGERIAMVDKL